MLRRAATALAWLLAGDVRAQQAPGVTSAVTIRIVVDSTGHARVTEEYRVPNDSGALQLQLLRRRCTPVSAVRLSAAAKSVMLLQILNSPWTALRDTSGALDSSNGDSAGFGIRYAVSLLQPTADIPLVHLTRAIPRRESEREGGVSVSVVTDGEVEFPRLSRTAARTWTGRFVAIPSFVRVSLPPATTPRRSGCGNAADADVTDGGLTWRFWTLIGIMVAWVPLYLGWARRTQEGAEG